MIDWMVSFYPDDAGQIVQLFLPKSLAQKPSAIKNIIIQGKGELLPIAHKEQADALKIISNSKNQRILLHGDTGTGKTRVFIERAIASY